MAAQDLSHDDAKIPSENGVQANDSEKSSHADKKDDSDAAQTNAEKKEEPPVIPGEICEVKAIRQRINKAGEPETFEKDTTTEKSPFAKYAFVRIATYDPDTKKTSHSIEINSPIILNALREVVTFYPGEALDFADKVTYKSPYMVIHHHRDELCEYHAKASDNQIKEHVQLLLDFIQEDGAEYEKLLSSSLTDYKHAWVIFKPGTLLYECANDHESLARVMKVGRGEHPKTGNYLEVRMQFTSCDGDDVGTSEKQVMLFEKGQYFVGSDSLEITSLPLFPLSYVSDPEEVKARLTARGQDYLKIKGVRMFHYDGLHLFLKVPPDDYYDECSEYKGKWLPATCRGRVIVDAKTFTEEMKSQAEAISRYERDDTVSVLGESNKPGELTSKTAEPMLCPAYVFGFNLESKEWCKFFVDSLQPVDWTPDALAQLVLPERRKNIIRSLVSAHQYPETKSLARDEARSKGQGLCFLLHGTPGSGKTLTAELVAEHTQRALLNISIGELGSWEHRIATQLKRMLTYAARWHVVVLIDEADVFLESRSSGSSSSDSASSDALYRNAFVAVFLRQLEYFQGIIFLTSNRVAVFDPAIRSRIHLALRYEPPDAAMRARLWSNKILAIPASQKSINLNDLEGEVTEAKMNGRDISNAVNTARTLARDAGEKLGIEQIKAVVTLWREFEEVMDSIQERPSPPLAEPEAKKTLL